MSAVDREPILLVDVARLEVGPGDVLVVRVHGIRLTQERAQMIKAQVAHYLPEIRAMVVDEHTSLEVVRDRGIRGLIGRWLRRG